MKITSAEARRAISEHLTRAVEEGATVLHMCALVTDDDETTFEDAIKVAFSGRRG